MPLLIVAFLLLTLLPAAAQDFPTGVVRIVVPFPAGGGLDNMARPLADRLSKLWNKPVIVENKPGANGQLGGKSVATAPPDGHTLLLPDGSVITSNPFLYKNSTLDPMKELAPVTQLIDLHQFVLVHPSVNARSMNELVTLAKSLPDGALTYGSYGHGSPPHLLYGMLNHQTGTNASPDTIPGNCGRYHRSPDQRSSHDAGQSLGGRWTYRFWKTGAVGDLQ